MNLSRVLSGLAACGIHLAAIAVLIDWHAPRRPATADAVPAPIWTTVYTASSFRADAANNQRSNATPATRSERFADQSATANTRVGSDSTKPSETAPEAQARAQPGTTAGLLAEPEPQSGYSRQSIVSPAPVEAPPPLSLGEMQATAANIGWPSHEGLVGTARNATARNPGSNSTTPYVDADWSGNIPPAYPFAARRLGEQGEVRLDVHVDSDGAVLAVRLRQSSGSPRLDRSAMDAVRGWRFIPARHAETPIAAWYHDWRWVFKLDG